jgi:putative PEP-CTERM system histidine kinase
MPAYGTAQVLDATLFRLHRTPHDGSARGIYARIPLRIVRPIRAISASFNYYHHFAVAFSTVTPLLISQFLLPSSWPSLWHWIALAAFVVMFAYVAVAGARGLLQGYWLCLALVGALWSWYFASHLRDSVNWQLDARSFAVEFAFLSAWFLTLIRLLRGPYRRSMPEIVRRCLLVFWMSLAVAGAAIESVGRTGEFGELASAAWTTVALAGALLCFALAAQLSRDVPVEDHVALRALVRGTGAVAAAEVFTFGVGLLGASTPAVILITRAAVIALAALTIVRAVSLRPQWSLAIFVSPQARTYAPRLVATLAVFVTLLAFAPFARSMKPEMAHPLAVMLIGATGAPVAALLFSQRLSASLRVFLAKHFLPFRYDYREEWLRLIHTLVSPEQRLPLPERVIKAVAQIVGSPAGLLWIRTGQDGHFSCKARWNTKMWSDALVQVEDPAIRFMFERQWIIDTAELARNPAMYNGLARPAWLEQFPDALLVVPLIGNEALIGFMVLLQSSSAFRLTFEEIDLLRTSGRQVAAHLAQYESDQQLAEAKQFEAFNRLTAFVMHDLKNLIAQQSLVVRNAARHKSNPAFFEDAIATIDNSVARMSKLLQQLQSGEASGRKSRVNLLSALQEAVERCRGRIPEPVLAQAVEDLHANLEKERFAMVAAHLVRNAQEASETDGRVEIGVRREQGFAVITIEDNGCGMDPEFVRTRLFQPFDTTKGSKGMGIGAYQARSFVVEAGGTLDVWSEPGRGTRITIRLPLAVEAPVEVERA